MPGRPPKLDTKARERLERILLRGAKKADFSTDLWTCPRVAEVIEEQFRRNYHVDHVCRVLHRLGWSPQKPQRRAIEHDEEAIEGIAPSATARDQSITSASFNCANKASRTSCHTPACCQARRRHQQVMPLPHPIFSWGRYSQGIPVRNTNRMPVNTRRFAMVGRPLLLGGLVPAEGSVR